MMLNIRELTQKGGSIDLTGTFDTSGMLSGREDAVELEKLAAELTAESKGGLAEVQGTLRVNFRVACSRCLKPVDETLAIPFRERFAFRAEVVPHEDQDEVHLIAEDHIKLDPYVEEAVWLALPLAPVCSDDCQGLCPECGSNLNDEPCSCRKETIDPRLAGLADFFKS